MLLVSSLRIFQDDKLLRETESKFPDKGQESVPLREEAVEALGTPGREKREALGAIPRGYDISG